MIPEGLKKTLDGIMSLRDSEGRECWRIGEVHAVLLGRSEGLLRLVTDGAITVQQAKIKHDELVEAREYADMRLNERHKREVSA